MNDSKHRRKFWISAVVLILLVSSLFLIPRARTPEEHLQRVVSRMIRLLEKGEHRQLLETWMDPVLLEGLKKLDLFEHTVNQFSGEPGARLLEALRKTTGVPPELNADKTQAIFLPAGYPYPLRFVRNGESWYLMQE